MKDETGIKYFQLLKICGNGNWSKRVKEDENHQSRDPQYLSPITHRRGWSKVREQASQKVFRVLLEEGNKHAEAIWMRRPFVILISAQERIFIHVWDIDFTLKDKNSDITFSPAGPGRPSSPLSPWRWTIFKYKLQGHCTCFLAMLAASLPARLETLSLSYELHMGLSNYFII